MISVIHLLSSGLMVPRSHVEVSQIVWMFESLDKTRVKGLLVASAVILCRETPEVLRHRIYSRRHLYSDLTRHVSKSPCIERINLRHYDVFITPCLILLQALALGVIECCNAETTEKLKTVSKKCKSKITSSKVTFPTGDETCGGRTYRSYFNNCIGSDY